MLNSTPEIKSKIDKLWNLFYSGGLSNPLSSIEQISYLIYMRRLEDMDVHQKEAAQRRGQKYASIFKGKEECRWSQWMHYDAEGMLQHVRDKVFPFIKQIRVEGSFYAEAMKDAVFMIPKPSLVQEAVQIIDGLNLSAQGMDVQGDIYEYLLSEISQSGKNGQFRTPRHIIRMIVDMVDPKLGDRVCDPACGTAGFLIGAYNHILEANTDRKSITFDEDGAPHNLIGDHIADRKKWDFLWNHSFFGHDFDTTMVRIALMNMVLHGIANPNISYADTLSKHYAERGRYDVILANPPFKGSIDRGDLSEDLRPGGAGQKPKTELLFLNLFVKLLVPGGRCGVIVPDGVLFGSSNMHLETRKTLIEKCGLQGVVSMPSGVFRPYAGVSTAVLVFAKGEKTDKIWFYDMEADGYSLDDKRDKIEKNDIPDLLKEWHDRDKNKNADRTAKHFFVPLKDVIENKYDLSINRYREIKHEEVVHRPPREILADLGKLEEEIQKGMKELGEMLK